MRLFAVELRRFHARLMLRILLVVGIVIVALTVVGAWSSARPMSGAELEQADQAYAQAEADWKQSGDQQMADCLAQQAEAQKTDPSTDFGCDQMAPQREWFVRTPPAFGQYVPGVVSGMVFLLGFLSLIAGGTFTAAEASSRSLTTWLTFEPRRIRVLASKLAAAGAGTVLPAAGLVALAVGGAMGAFAMAGADTAMTAAEVTATVHASLRLVALASLVAVVASALGLLLRHTAAVLGVAIGYLVVVENILPGLLPRTQPWLLMTNVMAWASGGTTYGLEECTTTATGRSCAFVSHPVTMTHGAVYLAVAAVVVVGVTVLVFRRRDHA
jgi:ABC-2 type transport system permease protein